MRYPIMVRADDDGMLLITCPLLPEVSSVCDDDDEADLVGPACAAILAVFTRRITERMPIPLLHTRGQAALGVPTQPRQYASTPNIDDEPSLFITFGASIALKVELHNAMVTAGMRKADLGRRLGVHPPIVDRLLDLDHGSRIEQIEAALSVLGREVEITTRAV